MQGNSLASSSTFQEYATSVKDKSENIIKNIFPKKIDELNELLDSEEFSFDDQQKLINEANGTANAYAINTVVSGHIDTCKPLIRELMDHTNNLKMWLRFLIPKIEDGNNFGVDIQEETLAEIENAEAAAVAFYDSITSYHIKRAQLLSKVAKHSQINDYRKVIIEVDETQFLALRLVLLEVRNYYAKIYDLTAKNWEKIIVPRSSNIESMY